MDIKVKTVKVWQQGNSPQNGITVAVYLNWNLFLLLSWCLQFCLYQTCFSLSKLVLLSKVQISPTVWFDLQSGMTRINQEWLFIIAQIKRIKFDIFIIKFGERQWRRNTSQIVEQKQIKTHQHTLKQKFTDSKFGPTLDFTLIRLRRSLHDLQETKHNGNTTNV